MVSPVSILRQLLGTLVAVLGGWTLGILTAAIVAFTGIGGAQRDAALDGTIMTSFAMWVFIIPVWAIALIPLYLFVPLSSPLWRPYPCAAFGALGGVLSVAVYSRASFDYDMVSFYAVAAVVGTGTCFTGALTHRYFKRRKPSNQAIQRTANHPYA